MDSIGDLSSKLSNLTFYDVKAMYNQVRRLVSTRENSGTRPAEWVLVGEEHGLERERDGGEGAGGDERRALVRLFSFL
jgi:hypothetical protein